MSPDLPRNTHIWTNRYIEDDRRDHAHRERTQIVLGVTRPPLKGPESKTRGYFESQSNQRATKFRAQAAAGRSRVCRQRKGQERRLSCDHILQRNCREFRHHRVFKGERSGSSKVDRRICRAEQRAQGHLPEEALRRKGRTDYKARDRDRCRASRGDRDRAQGGSAFADARAEGDVQSDLNEERKGAGDVRPSLRIYDRSKCARGNRTAAARSGACAPTVTHD